MPVLAPEPSLLKSRLAAGLVGAALAVSLGLGLHSFRLGQTLLYWSYDLPFIVRPVVRPQEVVVVYMDDESHEKLGQSRLAPWDRSLHAQLVDRLSAAGARAIVFDVVFSDPGPVPEHDQQLARAFRASGRVILAADTVPAGLGTPTRQRAVIPPLDLFRDAAASFGSAETLPCHDFAIRQHFHGTADDLVPSLSWATAVFVGAPVTRQPEARLQERWINYYGPPGTLPHLSYYRALDPQGAPDWWFRDRVVFVGAWLLTKFAGERKDEFRNPFSYWRTQDRFISGVEVQATQFLNLIRGDWLRRWPDWVERLVLAVLGAALGWVLFQCRPLTATGLALGLSLGTAATATGLFVGQRLWFPWLVVVAQVTGTTLGSIVFNSIRLYIQKRLYEQTLALYLSPKLVKKFASDPTFLKPGAEKQTLTILFTDIADFTTLSEGVDSDELARVMNQYFERAVTECIHPTDGTVVKYIGDAIFAFWNAPEPQPDHALRACRAALALARLPPLYLNGRPLRTRLGLHTGVVNVGNFGSTARVDYTALGDNVNLASRMEGLNKHLGTTLLATADTYAAVADRIVSRPCGRFRLKGFEKAVEVHELLGWVEEADLPTRPWREAFAQGLLAFQQRDFATAEAHFRRTLALRPDDGPARFYLAQSEQLRLQPPPPDWTGEIELKEK
jgi:adenylate cyclase